jgi:surface protein
MSDESGESSKFSMQTSQPPIGDISVAVQLWLSDPEQATAEYGRIEEWDTSEVTDMSELFFGQTEFNDGISGWDVSQVTIMSSMFSGATSFNQDLSGWDVSQVMNMGDMFRDATAFNQDLSGWDVSQVTEEATCLVGMFNDATSFNYD